MKIEELTKTNFKLFTHTGLVFIDFYADWCMPCNIMKPIYSKLSEEFNGKIKFTKVDVDKNQLLAQNLGIVSLPTFLLLKDGETIKQYYGIHSFDDFKNALSKDL